MFTAAAATTPHEQIRRSTVLILTVTESLEEEVGRLERHLHVLTTVIANEPIGIEKISNELGYPHHKVRYSLRRLEEAEVIEPTTQGAITTDQAEPFVEILTDDLDAPIDTRDSMKTNGAQISQHS